MEPLTTLFATSQFAVARLHALWTLEGLHTLETRLIEKALEDPEAGVRENAILLAEPRLSGSPALVEKLLTMERDPDRRVQFQLLCTLGGIDSRASHVVDTTSSGMIEGVMSARTPTTITIRHEAGREEVIRRTDIKSMRITNLSAMPADLDRQITIDQMADLLRFLKTAR